MATSTEQVCIWLLEALDEEWQREPDIMKCRHEGEVLTPVRDAHELTNADLDRAVKFMELPERRYITRRDRPDGIAMLPTDAGRRMLGAVQMSRLEEREKKKWKRSEKIALASFILSVVSFFAGIHVGEQAAKKSDSMPILSPPTNSVAGTLPKSH